MNDLEEDGRSCAPPGRPVQPVRPVRPAQPAQAEPAPSSDEEDYLSEAMLERMQQVEREQAVSRKRAKAAAPKPPPPPPAVSLQAQARSTLEAGLATAISADNKVRRAAPPAPRARTPSFNVSSSNTASADSHAGIRDAGQDGLQVRRALGGHRQGGC